MKQSTAWHRTNPGPWRALTCGVLLSAGLLALPAGVHAQASPTGAPSALSATRSPGLERPAALQAEVDFWVRIYAAVSSTGGLVHDDRRLGVVYEQMEFSPGTPAAERRRQVDAARARYATLLRMLAARIAAQPPGMPLDPATLTPDEARVYALWPAGTLAAELTAAAGRIRFQLGQRDRFLEGYIRAGAYESHLREVMERLGLPGEIAALPHVESSFNARAYSKVGAAGMWQFMPSTGRRWLRVDDVVDERRDPYKSTVAAARYLQLNHALLGTWPLALTAYNHGAGGLRRAKQQLGTDDIVRMIREYQGPAFGFASRNFFPCFLAALEVDRNAAKYFGPVRRDTPDDSRVIILPEYVPVNALVRVFEVDRDRLRDLNLPLMPAVWDGRRHVPAGYALRVPADAKPTQEALRELKPSERFAGQVRERSYKVRRGDTAQAIARKFGTSVRGLLANNGLKRAKQVKRGMVLRIPGTIAPPRASGPHMVYVPPTGNVWLAGLPVRGEAAPTVVVAAAQAEAAAGGEPMTGVPIAGGEDRVAAGIAQTLQDMGAEDSVAAAEADVAPEDRVLPGEQPPPLPTGEPEEVSGRELAAAQAAGEASEPVTEAAAEAEGPGLMPGVQAAANADPADYGVSEAGTVTVLGAETLSQLARWLGMEPARLRELNNLRSGGALPLGRRLKVEVAADNREPFERERTAWHRAMQAAYFNRFRIVGTERHRLRAGESLWSLTQRHAVPSWLLQQYNPDLDFAAVKVGMEVILPRVSAVPQAGTR